MLSERITARDVLDPSDAVLQGRALLDTLADLGWDCVAIGDRVQVLRMAGAADLWVPGFSEEAFAQGVADTLAERLILALRPFPCPRCGVARAQIEDSPCLACQEIAADG